MKNVFIVLFFFLSISAFSYTGEVVKSFNAPGGYSTGLCFDGKNLWVADRQTDKLYCVNPKSGKIKRAIESPAYWPTGLTYDGKYLWNADIRGLTDKSEHYDGKIFKIDPKDGTILKTFRAPSKSPQGLAWDGKYMWCVDDRADKLIQFSVEDGTTISSFKSPSKNPMGLTFDGKYLWTSDRVTDEIYMIDPATGYVIIIADAPGKYTRGLAYDGKNLWATDYQSDKIFKLKVRDGVKYIRKDEQTHKVVFNHRAACYGPGKIKTLDVNIGIPENRVNQDIIGEISYNIKPTEIVTDKWGQRTALFSYNNIKPTEERLSQMTVNFKSYNVRYFIYPEDVGELKDIPDDIKKKYLADNEKYQINHDVIKSTLKKVVGDEQNAYNITRKIHQYLIGHLHYIMDGAWDTAPTVLTNGHGSCSEYTFVFMALCKAAGIPTRYVGATWIKKDESSMDNVYHRWPEMYLPNYGWIPTDPTHGDREYPRDQAFPIGLVRNSALITTQSGGGSKTMEWTYNSNENYTTEPKTNLDITHYGDWEVVEELPKVVAKDGDVKMMCE